MKPHKPTSPHLVSFAGARPLALTKRQAVTALGSSKLVARMLWASRYAGDQWLVIVRSGRDLLIDTALVEAAYESQIVRGSVSKRNILVIVCGAGNRAKVSLAKEKAHGHDNEGAVAMIQFLRENLYRRGKPPVESFTRRGIDCGRWPWAQRPCNRANKVVDFLADVPKSHRQRTSRFALGCRVTYDRSPTKALQRPILSGCLRPTRSSVGKSRVSSPVSRSTYFCGALRSAFAPKAEVHPERSRERFENDLPYRFGRPIMTDWWSRFIHANRERGHRGRAIEA
jgi:hypothetical protein